MFQVFMSKYNLSDYYSKLKSPTGLEPYINANTAILKI